MISFNIIYNSPLFFFNIKRNKVNVISRGMVHYVYLQIQNIEFFNDFDNLE